MSYLAENTRRHLASSPTLASADVSWLQYKRTTPMSTDIKNKSFDQLIKGDTPVLVDFYTDWCGPCKMMAPELKKVKKALGDRIIVLKINAETNPAAAIRYQVRGVPTLLLFRRGEELWRQSGVVPASHLTDIINQQIV